MVDLFLVGVWSVVGEEGIHLVEGRRKAGDIEAKSFQEAFLIRLFVGCQARAFRSLARTK